MEESNIDFGATDLTYNDYGNAKLAVLKILAMSSTGILNNKDYYFCIIHKDHYKQAAQAGHILLTLPFRYAEDVTTDDLIQLTVKLENLESVAWLKEHRNK